MSADEKLIKLRGVLQSSITKVQHRIDSLDSSPSKAKAKAKFTRGNMVGTRAQVFRGVKHHTSGNLRMQDLKKNKFGKIVSRKASKRATKKHKANPGFLLENRAPSFAKTPSQ